VWEKHPAPTQQPAEHLPRLRRFLGEHRVPGLESALHFRYDDVERDITRAGSSSDLMEFSSDLIEPLLSHAHGSQNR
jgi:hypothetical protein